jgi:hypothetical protein
VSRSSHDRRPPESTHSPGRAEPKPGGAIALALERARLKK